MNSTEKILLTTPHKINVGFYGLAQSFVSLWCRFYLFEYF